MKRKQTIIVGDHSAQGAMRLSKLLKSPYFGRIDFTARGAPDALPVYIGIHSFYDPEAETHLVHDWRAPGVEHVLQRLHPRDAQADADIHREAIAFLE